MTSIDVADIEDMASKVPVAQRMQSLPGPRRRTDDGGHRRGAGRAGGHHRQDREARRGKAVRPPSGTRWCVSNWPAHTGCRVNRTTVLGHLSDVLGRTPPRYSGVSCPVPEEELVLSRKGTMTKIIDPTTYRVGRSIAHATFGMPLGVHPEGKAASAGTMKLGSAAAPKSPVSRRWEIDNQWTFAPGRLGRSPVL